MARPDVPNLSRTLAVLLAGGEGTRLHELGALEAKPALPFAGRRLVDFAVASAVAAGVTRMAVALQHRPATLDRHLPGQWGRDIELLLRDGPRLGGFAGTAEALARCLETCGGPPPREVLVLPADQAQALDLRALIAAHRESGAPVTLAEPPFTGSSEILGPCVFEAGFLAEALRRDAEDEASTRDLWNDLLPLAAGRGDIATWQVPEGTYWRDIDTLDAFRDASLDFTRGAPPCPLPPAERAGPIDEDRQAIAIAAGGLTLTAPRFGARTPGRWTLLEDTIIMPGARVASGARLSRAIVAPGAIVPAGLVVGDDPAEDARWFRVTSGGTTLITAPMLAARAAERMRAQFGGRLAGLATPGHQ
ncbi:Glucose-1-phosphate adenylyltransferase [Rubellimicrobium mesophilum DSM 19309]|uniref:Glucose-1-phosphate adenylyltransferase n=1 Tax=Rubellimicrobium mesophilum DSM 19309 TaxID=442562 RepID=A0A017HN51_9RHOB|nr:sugar phosphate nucleotidyltransferase [Rubellimicrobium mesophilum]EYD75214.1 Glucose-1-phosphate adenylyltransferase [Rubellimicrobium mesophilum DSM 19309]